MNHEDNPFPPADSALPRNAVSIQASLSVAIGSMVRTYTTAVLIQTNDRAEIEWAIQAAWRNVSEKESSGATDHVRTEKRLDTTGPGDPA